MQTAQAKPVHAGIRRDGATERTAPGQWAARLVAFVVAHWQVRRAEAEFERMCPHLRRDIGLGERPPTRPNDLLDLWMR